MNVASFADRRVAVMFRMAEPRDWSWFENPKQAKRRRERGKWDQEWDNRGGPDRGGPPDRRGSGDFRGPPGPFPGHGPMHHVLPPHVTSLALTLTLFSLAAYAWHARDARAASDGYSGSWAEHATSRRFWRTGSDGWSGPCSR